MTKNPDHSASLPRGIETIKKHLETLPDRPGVYRMIGVDGAVLYVGKAKALKKRVTSYTQPDRLSGRIKRMVSLTHGMEFVETNTEGEALLLEANLIKSLDPVYNVLLKDDKMYPYLVVHTDHDFPNIVKYRGVKKNDGLYYGPFLSGLAVNDTLGTLHRIFQIRNCSNSYFAARKRPCLQYHIKRCTAPCVGKVSATEYARQIENACAFLDGKSRDIQDAYARMMQEASARQDYETAALYRDKIRMLSGLLARQTINLNSVRNADVIAIANANGLFAIQVFFFRAGQNYGNVSFFPRQTDEETNKSVLCAFIGQFYADKTPPETLILSHEPEDSDLLQSVLSNKAGRKVAFIVPRRGDKKDILTFAERNTQESLARHMAGTTTSTQLMSALQTLFTLDCPPERIEVYDNSHLGGTGQIGAMIVAGPEGFRKNAYRKFNIRDAGAGDDYAMMREVMIRRFSRALSEDQGPGTENWPDLILIDGGRGQLGAVREALSEMGILDQLTLVGIAKGPDRNAGREVFHVGDRPPFQMPVHDPVLHYLQRLRDEAHRFAIGTQRIRRQGNLTKSILDSIPGIGAKRKKALLLHFGSAQTVAGAAPSDLEKVQGISKAFAQKLYQYFHGEKP